MMQTRRELRLRQRYEQPGDWTVILYGIRSWFSKVFNFMFSWYFFLQRKSEERKHQRRVEDFDNLMDIVVDDIEEERSVEDDRFAQIASQMRGDSSAMEREIYIEQRFYEIVKAVLSIITMLVFCTAVALLIVLVGKLAYMLFIQ